MSIKYFDGGAAVVETAMGGVGVFFEGSAPPQKTTEARHSVFKFKPQSEGVELEVPYAHWGTNNLFPQNVITEMDKSGVGKAGLRIRAKSHFGGGPLYLRDRGPGDRQPVPFDAPELAPVLAWHRANRLPVVQRELINGYEWWGMTLVECVVSNDARTILSVRPVKPAWTRFSLQDEQTGRIEWAVVNPNWSLGTISYTKLVPVADPWWSAQELRAKLLATGHRKFILPSWIPDPDMGYYPTMDWHATYLSGWLQSTNNIPALKKAVMENQVTIKYHIEIPMRYWEVKYKDSWATLKEPERQAKMKDTLEAIDSFLKGSDKAGKSLITYFETDEMGNPLPGWKITALDDKLKDGAYIPDSEKGNSEILASMAVDPTLLGQGAPGGKLGAGSGSDKREAIVILQALQGMDRDHTTEWWNLVRDYNGWPQDLCLGYAPMPLPVMDSNLPAPGPAPTPEPAA